MALKDGCCLSRGDFSLGRLVALITRVLGVKQNGRKTFVITDAAMNDLIRPPPLYQAHHEIVPVNAAYGTRTHGGHCGAGVRIRETSLRAIGSSRPWSQGICLRCSTPARTA